MITMPAGEGDSRQLLVRALGASLAVHLVALLLIPALAWMPSSAAIETISFARIERIAVTPPRHPEPQPRPVALTQAVVPKITMATRVELAHTASKKNASPPPATAKRLSAAPTVANFQRAGTGAGDKDTMPAPTSTPAERAVASLGGHNAGGDMPFGAEQPDPVLDPGMLKQLHALNVHVTLVVTVGDDGKTKKIAFTPDVDPQIESRIESLLADASWDPAVCGGGISCEGQATIKL